MKSDENVSTPAELLNLPLLLSLHTFQTVIASDMLASELALDIGVDPSVISKRLNVYFSETGEQRERYLSARTVENVRRAQQLLESGKARTFKDAVRMVLGTFAEPVPPESVRVLEKRLAQLETVQAETLDRVNRILQYMEMALAHPSSTHGHDRP